VVSASKDNNVLPVYCKFKLPYNKEWSSTDYFSPFLQLLLATPNQKQLKKEPKPLTASIHFFLQPERDEVSEKHKSQTLLAVIMLKLCHLTSMLVSIDYCNWRQWCDSDSITTWETDIEKNTRSAWVQAPSESRASVWYFLSAQQTIVYDHNILEWENCPAVQEPRTGPANIMPI